MTVLSETERLVRFELLGQEYSFYTGASETEMEAILALVKEQVEGGAGSARGTLPASKIAVMACLNMASKYVKLQNEFEEYRNETEKRHIRLQDEIRNTLQTG